MKTKLNFLFIFIALFAVGTTPLLADQEFRIGLASNSPIKKAAVEKLFHLLFPKHRITLSGYSIPSDVAAQPVGLSHGTTGASQRLQNAKALAEKDLAKDYWVSIENFIEVDAQNPSQWIDRAVVIVQKNNHEPAIEISRGVTFDAHFAEQARQLTPADYPFIQSGYASTVGKLIEQNFATQGVAIAHDNWQKQLGGVSRSKQIQEALARAIIKNEIRAYADFPKKGILFQDMSPLLANPDLFEATLQFFAQAYQDKNIDVVAGLDARGFILGAPLALKLNKPFIPVRKKGKLPNPSHSVRFVKEYGEDEIEISSEQLQGKTVLIIDDLLATGGTLEATEALFRSAGAKSIYSTCLIELMELKGREKLKSPFSSLLKY